MSNTESNKQILRLWIEEGWNKNRNEELAHTVFHEDWISENALPNQPSGIEGVLFWVAEYRKIFSSIHFEITHIIAENDFITYRYLVTARHTGTFLGIAATNKPVKYSGIAILRFEDNKIIQTWNETNFLSIQSQLKL